MTRTFVSNHSTLEHFRVCRTIQKSEIISIWDQVKFIFETESPFVLYISFSDVCQPVCERTVRISLSVINCCSFFLSRDKEIFNKYTCSVSVFTHMHEKLFGLKVSPRKIWPHVKTEKWCQSTHSFRRVSEELFIKITSNLCPNKYIRHNEGGASERAWPSVSLWPPVGGRQAQSSVTVSPMMNFLSPLEQIFLSLH